MMINKLGQNFAMKQVAFGEMGADRKNPATIEDIAKLQRLNTDIIMKQLEQMAANIKEIQVNTRPSSTTNNGYYG